MTADLKEEIHRRLVLLGSHPTTCTDFDCEWIEEATQIAILQGEMELDATLQARARPQSPHRNLAEVRDRPSRHKPIGVPPCSRSSSLPRLQPINWKGA